MPKGRPIKLTPLVQRRIVEALERGHFHNFAARYAGIDPDTLARYMIKGEKPDAPAMFREFHDAVKKAEATYVDDSLQTIRQHEDWRARAWHLERRFPKYFVRQPDPASGGDDPVNPEETFL